MLLGKLLLLLAVLAAPSAAVLSQQPLEQEEGGQGAIHAPRSGPSDVDAVLRACVAGLAPVTMTAQNSLPRVLEYLVLSLPQYKRLHEAVVPEMDVPQVTELLTLISDPEAPVLRTLLAIKPLLEVLVGPPGGQQDDAPAGRAGLPPTGFPIMRRAFMAWVVQQHLAGRPWSHEESELLRLIARYLHRLHRVAAEAKHVLEFFHVSKAGGSTLCQLGVANGCSTQNSSMRENCMIREFRDFPRWSRADALPGLLRTPWCARYGVRRGTVTCGTRRALLSKMRWNFFANEYVMHTPGATGLQESFRQARPCPENLYVMVFRDPAARLLSHMQNVLREYTFIPPPKPAEPVAGGAIRKLSQAFVGLIGEQPARVAAGAARPGVGAQAVGGQEDEADVGAIAAPSNLTVPQVFYQLFDPLDAAAWQALAPPVVDNYFLRSLLGEQAYMAPLHSLSLVHLAVGKLVTLQLDVLLTLELPALNDASFDMGLGWSLGFKDLHARLGTTMNTTEAPLGPSAAQLLAAAVAPLLVDNALDRELYEFAAVAQMMDAVAWGLAKAALPSEVLAALDERRTRQQCGFVGTTGRRRRALRQQQQQQGRGARRRQQLQRIQEAAAAAAGAAAAGGAGGAAVA